MGSVYQRKIRLRHSKRQKRGGLLAFIKRNDKAIKYENNGAWDMKAFEQWSSDLFPRHGGEKIKRN